MQDQIDFDFVEQLLQILRPLERFTNILSSRDSSILSVLPTYYALKNHLPIENAESRLLNNFKVAVLAGITRRMVAFEPKK